MVVDCGQCGVHRVFVQHMFLSLFATEIGKERGSINTLDSW